MRGKQAWIHPAAWMIGLAAATASAMVLVAVISTFGMSVFFERFLVDHHLQLAVVGHIGCFLWADC
jgi:hypothetical protein